MKRLSDVDIEGLLLQSKDNNIYSNATIALQGKIMIELQLRTIDELKRLYGATH